MWKDRSSAKAILQLLGSKSDTLGGADYAGSTVEHDRLHLAEQVGYAAERGRLFTKHVSSPVLNNLEGMMESTFY